MITQPNPVVRAQFSDFLQALKQQEPDQYFYRPEEFHVTVLTLVSAAATFKVEETPLALYGEVFSQLCQSFPPFRIYFKGITASPAAVMAQGYAEANRLNELRGGPAPEPGRSRPGRQP